MSVKNLYNLQAQRDKYFRMLDDVEIEVAALEAKRQALRAKITQIECDIERAQK